MSNQLPVTTRPICNRDESFIYNSWIRSYWEHSDWAKLMDKRVFDGQHHALIQGLIENAKVLVAVNPDDFDHIFGYVAFDTIDALTVIHYVYVKSPYLRLGVGKKLLEATGYQQGMPLIATHWTRPCKELRHKIPMVFIPYLAFQPRKGALEQGVEIINASKVS